VSGGKVRREKWRLRRPSDFPIIADFELACQTTPIYSSTSPFPSLLLPHHKTTITNYTPSQPQ
jgi:hypothetical protein